MTLTTRPTVPDDAPALLAMLRELAAFEGGAVAATEEDFRRDGFGPQARFEALFAEVDGKPVGFVITFPIYSSWAGKPGVMVHDLFVRPEARGTGAGSALLRAVAQRAVAKGCGRVDVNVLHWNSAVKFYEGLGFVQQPDWRLHRLDGAALEKLGSA